MINRHPHSRRRSFGFSLIELLVGLAIGLLGAIAMLQIFALSEGQKRTTTSGSDAQSNGAIALYTIERDVRMAGYGMTNELALGCNINASYDGAAFTWVLAPIRITSGGLNGEPDSIRVMASSKSDFSTPYRFTKEHPPTSDIIPLDTTLGMAEGDMLIAFEPGKDCTAMQATKIDNGTVKVHHQNTSPWNPPGGLNIMPKPDGYVPPAIMINLGSMLDRTYSVNATASLQLASYVSATNTTTTETLFPQIVNIQAEYGKDTDSDNIVDTWDAVTPDTNAKWNQLRAIRMVLVARSGLYEREEVTTVLPTWSGSGSAGGVSKIGIDLNADWKHFRYKTFETVIPLRNMIWKPS